MRVLVQRVNHAAVSVNGQTVGSISRGLLLLVGFTHGDTSSEIAWIARKITGLRIFEDARDKMNLSVQDIGGSILAVPQFTLYGTCERGRRPDFTAAAAPEPAHEMFDTFCTLLRETGIPVATGAFRQHMHVTLENDGPVSVWVTREPDTLV
jgi:D-tyrosyl-tRNA(Tyr) deacylase